MPSAHRTKPETKPMVRMPIPEIPKRPVNGEWFAQFSEVIHVEAEMGIIPLGLWARFRRKKNRGIDLPTPKKVSTGLDGVDVSPLGLFHFLPGPLAWRPIPPKSRRE